MYFTPLSGGEIRKNFHKPSKFCFLGHQQSFYQQKYYKNWHFLAIEKCLCPPCATVIIINKKEFPNKNLLQCCNVSMRSNTWYTPAYSLSCRGSPSPTCSSDLQTWTIRPGCTNCLKYKVFRYESMSRIIPIGHCANWPKCLAIMSISHKLFWPTGLFSRLLSLSKCFYVQTWSK